LASLGYREVVLTGIDLGAYGRDFGGSPDLAEILEAAAKVEGIARVRLSSVDPTDVTERLINVMADCGGVCPPPAYPIAVRQRQGAVAHEPALHCFRV